jgi:hypothetical protein
VVASGTVGSPDFGVARLTTEGALDPDFGGDGLVSTSFPNPNFEQRSAFGVALQPDGKVVAVGGGFGTFNGSDFLVARYGTNPPPPTSSPPAQQPPTTPKKKCKKKKKHRAAAAKKCKKKKK